MADTRILQWNCDGFYAKFNDILDLKYEYNPAVMALQELRIGNRDKINLQGYHTLQSLGKAAGLLIRRDIPHAEIQLRTTLQAVAATLFIGKQYTVCSLYTPARAKVQYQELYDLYIQLPQPVLILGDLNARDPLWGDIKPVGMNKAVKKIIEEENLTLMNTGEYTHYHIQTDTYTCVDLSLVSVQVCNDFSWKAIQPEEKSYESDHFPIVLTKVNDNSYHPQPQKWNFKRAKWDLYKKKTENNFETETERNIEERCAQIKDIIINAAMESIPLIKPPKSKKQSPYWNEECKKAKETKRRLYRRMLRTKLLKDKIEYNRARALERKCIKEAKKKSWHEYVNTINSQTSCSEVWKKIKKISGRHPKSTMPVIRDANGVIQTNPEITSEIIGDKLAHFSNGHNYTENFQRYRYRMEKNTKKSPNSNAEYNEDFSMAELKAALAKSKKKSSPGEDNINYEMIRHLHETTLQEILKIYNTIWKKGKILNEWKITIIISIKKAVKVDWIVHTTDQYH